MAQEKIKLTKKVYDKSSAGDLIDRSFSEIINLNDSINNVNLDNNIKRLFTLYNDIFYDIPKVGKQSHTTLFKQSRDYIGNYIDSKDAEIEALIDQIVDLEQKLSNQDQPNEEHPFYRNGTLIVDREAFWNIYYMDRATRRKLGGNENSELFKDLLAATGYKGDNWKDGVTFVSPQVISKLTPGPDFGPEDLGASETNVEEERATFEGSFNYNALQDGELNPNNYPITEYTIPSNYDPSGFYNSFQLANYNNDITRQIEQTNIANISSYDKYREYLRNRIIIVWQSEKRFEILKDKYENDTEFGFTESERNKAQILRDAVMPKIRQAQETLVYYKRLWTFVKNKSANSANAKSLMLEAQANFEDNINTPVTDNERNDYGGWNKGQNNFPNIDLEGLTSSTGEGGNLY